MVVVLLSLAWASPQADCAAAERDGRFEAMAAQCAACDTGFCAGRVAWLEDRRDADGGFAALTALDRARRGETGAAEVAAAIGPQTSPFVAAEAGMWLARAEPDRAVAHLRDAAAVAPPALARRVDLALAMALAESGQLAEAERVEAPHRLGPTRPSPVQALAARRRHRAMAAVAGVVVALFGLVSLRGESVHPWGLVPLAVGVGGCALYASLYAEGAGAALWLFLPGAALLHLLSARALTRSPSTWRRAFAAVATVAWALLALWWTGALAEVGL